MRPTFNRFGPKHDYRGAQAVSPDGKLWDIVDIYRREYPPAAVMAVCRSFNREKREEYALSVLDILERV